VTTSWQTTVSGLVLIFRDALAALVPHMERAKLPWREGEAYDEWDEISEVIFDKIVAQSLRCALGPEGESLRLPRYDMVYDNYRDFSFIAVQSG